MTVLAQDRNTPRRTGDVFSFPVAAATKIYAGALAVLNAGVAEGGSTAVGLVAVGRAEEQVDNSAGAAGELKVRVAKGTFRFANSAAADEITLSEVGASAYIVDDQTVAKTDGTGTRSVAGTIVDVDDLGVWVKFD
ncbi:MAG: hypothetical protein IH626_01800 [Rhodospirillales bacterium]|nr:hypothetical protein [Rhodospirillales bacterium]